MLIAKDPIKSPEINQNGQKHESLFSPRFRSVAAMAGWDEEALLIASLIVEDTPDRQPKHKKRPDLHNFKTPPSNSRRKRRAQRRSPASIPIAVLDLDEDESKSKQESEKIEKKANTTEEVVGKSEKTESDVSNSSPAIPCLDRLREELSCAICLEICYEPSTTPCGHSFCKKCLRSAADRCGKKCPKCRQLISNGRYCTVNTVLWNTIQLIFPKEVEARKTNEASALDTHEQQQPQPQAANPSRSRNLNTRNRVVQALNSPESERRSGPERRSHHHRIRNHRSSRTSGTSGVVSTRTALPGQDEDAALALRLQREEFMEAFEGRDSAAVARANLRAMATRDSVAVARANLRAMASRAHNIRVRGRRE
ncbi:tripartite motif-containing protein 65 [Phtheirospermum japonicum]|uniref:RING-type E3 ubiquitin transferase n=1 Tax=Phtheirospermum japonicum TaxID=374723 RepID=A0A830BFK1_9LAMI|nr:tripartite motif-containing protein 65 [Phtheirospermum japonicum]